MALFVIRHSSFSTPRPPPKVLVENPTPERVCWILFSDTFSPREPAPPSFPPSRAHHLGLRRELRRSHWQGQTHLALERESRGFQAPPASWRANCRGAASAGISAVQRDQSRTEPPPTRRELARA